MKLLVVIDMNKGTILSMLDLVVGFMLGPVFRKVLTNQMYIVRFCFSIHHNKQVNLRNGGPVRFFLLHDLFLVISENETRFVCKVDFCSLGWLRIFCQADNACRKKKMAFWFGTYCSQVSKL